MVLFTEHPTDDYDYFSDGHHDFTNGVLFIPGAEGKGLLAFPRRNV